MSGNNDFEEDASRRQYTRPYTGKHPIPTIQGYREHRKDLEDRVEQTEQSQQDEQDESKTKRAYHSTKAIFKGEDEPQSTHDPYPSTSRNDDDRPMNDNPGESQGNDGPEHEQKGSGSGNNDGNQQGKSATETAAGEVDPRKKRKAMKKMSRDDGGREVTDPVTHLPIVIHDQTDKDLKTVPENEAAPGSHHRTATGLSGAKKSRTELDEEKEEIDRGYAGTQKLFPPPSFEDTKAELERTYKLALTAGVGAVLALSVLSIFLIQLFSGTKHTEVNSDSSFTHQGTFGSRFAPILSLIVTTVFTSVAGVAILINVRGWLGKKVEEIWDDEVWDASRQDEIDTLDSEAELPESVAWLNSLFSSIWPLMNPDLFSSLVDMLEDVMQASLPKLVRMVSIDDVGQGSEAFRILGIRWLPTAAASQSVDADGNLSVPKNDEQNDRMTQGEGQEEASKEQDTEKSKSQKQTEQEKEQQKQEQQAIREGMEAEEGDFVNMELAFAYRARSSGKSIKTKAKNAHLYLKFYLPGGICVPVWVELRGIVGTMRLRLQLTPDPPFFSLCTLTFLGQPRANLSCVPLSRHALNLMDLPLISSFVQSAIDAALAEYVAPKSLTLDLKDMLVGDDFKKDTIARGVVLIFIKKARGFKEGDGGIGPMKGASDGYVTVSWGKFGKPVASTRVIVDSQEPNWNEWANILVTPEELNADENLRLQLWDSDKWTADDDLGRVELDLKDIMHGSKTRNQMCDREDRFSGQDTDEEMPGTLFWSVGYFSKTRITQAQLDKQTAEPEIRDKEKLKQSVSEMAERKLREAKKEEHGRELHQQKVQDYKEREDAMIISAPPDPDHPSGVLSIQIHNITGLEIQSLQKKETSEQSADGEDDADQNADLPDSYCNIILNHQKIYRTRTKPKNAKPFFNAGTERFIKDWRSTEVIVSVRDSREKEDDALLGVIYLPLIHVFNKRSQIIDTFPLAGGVGYGRARISLVWRSVDMQLDKNLIGWDYGTLQVKAPITIKGSLPDQLQGHRIKLRTNLGKAKLYPDSPENDSAGGSNSQWMPKGKKDKTEVFLGVRRRYSSTLIIEFRKSSIGFDSTPAFAVFWLSQIPDEEETTVTMKVWKGGKENLARAESSCDYEGLEADEQCLGEVEVTMKFWRGLSGYHKAYASKSRNMDVRNVMECLDTINDEAGDMAGEDLDEGGQNSDNSDSDSDSDNGDSLHLNGNTPATRKKLTPHTNQDSDGVSSDEDETASTKNPITMIKNEITSVVQGHNDTDDASRGVRAQIRDYKDHHKQLHRKHRGVMQWKGARTLNWMGGKARRAKGRVGEMFEHSEKDQGIETEV